MTLVGSGDIASVLPERDDLLFFASGVSDSLCEDEAEYRREMTLLLEQPKRAHIVYFSSLGALDGTTRYYRHKRDIEWTIKVNFPLYCIVRVGNITWGDNPRTLINYLKANPASSLVDEFRYIADKDEFLYWIDKIPSWSCEMNIPGRRLLVKEVVDEIRAGKL